MAGCGWGVSMIFRGFGGWIWIWMMDLELDFSGIKGEYVFFRARWRGDPVDEGVWEGVGFRVV